MNNRFSSDYNDIKNKLVAASSWQDKYRHLMLLGKSLPALDEQYKTSEFEVGGCESQVWLVIEKNNGQLLITADSDTRIAKGLVALLCLMFNDLPVENAPNINFNHEFSEMGLLNHLSPSRTNGLNAMVKHILTAI